MQESIITPEERARQLREMKDDTVVNCQTCGDNTELGCRVLPPAAAWMCQTGEYGNWRHKDAKAN